MSPPVLDLIATLACPGTVLLDTARSEAAHPRCLLFTRPMRVLTAQTLDEVPPLLDALDAAVAQGCYAAGYLSYEAGYVFEDRIPATTSPTPLAWFGVYESPTLLTSDAVTRALEAAGQTACAVRNLRLLIDRAAYLDKIAAVKAFIREGDVYQINFTDAFTFDFEGAPSALFGRLRQHQRVPFGAYLHTGPAHILSLSPELFFQRDGRCVWTKPMKGTVGRGRTLAEDQARRRILAADPKNRAENLMIVDLLRNDLSRCCVPGSVRVPALFETEVYETLIQMTSTVEGRLRDGMAYADLFAALFPCGSVTGAPKIRAMDIIHALEAGPRGVYCGAIGYVAPDDRAVFNVAIRTITLRETQGVMGTGSGIVWDSDPEAEYEECRLKARFLAQAVTPPAEDFELIETMLAEGQEIALLDLHEERMHASAQYFGFHFDAAAFRAQIGAALRALPPGRWKVRGTLNRRGRLTMTTALLPASPPTYRRLLIVDTPVDTSNVFFYHKTTNRRFYEDAYRRARTAGFDEVLFVNERGEMTEGSRTNLFIRRGKVMLTPPVADGLLGGVYRRHLLQTLPNAHEQTLTPGAVLAADAVYVCNAVQGLHAVETVQYPTGQYPTGPSSSPSAA